MNILICHERFLFRFGADRVLILLGKGLAELGHRVTMMGNRYDPEVLRSFAAQTVDVPSDSVPHLDLNEFTAEWLRQHWRAHFPSGADPDVAFVGGWPFLASIPFLRETCGHVICVDFGVVPTEGYPQGMRITLEKLRGLRRANFRLASLIVAISDFIAESQSKPDSHGEAPVRSVLLGADHVEQPVWPASRVHAATGESLLLVSKLRREQRKLVLCLGRWEPGCYKNSEAAFEIMRRLRRTFPDSALVVLEQPEKCKVPLDLEGAVFPIGFPDDVGLVGLMKQVDLGITLSLWEGFNLPLAEMQWVGRPALAFDLAAHPEVIAHPWYLCRDNEEMAAKAVEVLGGGGPDPVQRCRALERFHSYFRWRRFVQDYHQILEEMRPMVRKSPKIANPPFLVVDVTNSTRDPANSGVIRVTRRLGRTLQEHQDPLFVVWDVSSARYLLPTREEFEQLSRFNGPIPVPADRLSPSAGDRVTLDAFLQANPTSAPWLLLPEVILEDQFRSIRHHARERGFRIAALFYDAIPVMRPDLCNRLMRDNHRAYMEGLAECDLVVPISDFSANCLKMFWQEWGTAVNCEVIPNLLPGEYGGAARGQGPLPEPRGEVSILCVSTLEPRKNHRNLIGACLLLQQRHPELAWSLSLVGNRYEGAFEVADFVQEVASKNPRIRWLGIVDDATLHRLYQEATFTVYPSVIEGFGMPIVESLWHGRPCICSREGVMAELAAEGGCLTTDVEDVEQISTAIYRLATDRALLEELAAQARRRRIKTWEEYTLQLLGAIEKRQERILSSEKIAAPSPAWPEILYPRCVLDDWQMHDSERLALTAVLSRHQPYCAIEVGTYRGGSLSLIAQYSQLVFSIDLDPSIPDRLPQFKHVSFLTGDSGVILPYLLNELNQAGIPVDFILLDGDHTAAGIRRDVAPLLTYTPKKPLFVLLHDSFNPECRRGILEAGWARSPYCHFVDIDFVPGRIVESPGPSRGQLWGGLALAYFSPAERRTELRVASSAEMTFRRLNEWSNARIHD
jgi:glycosyltransferase involved in cell wall biosynthesis